MGAERGREKDRWLRDGGRAYCGRTGDMVDAHAAGSSIRMLPGQRRGGAGCMKARSGRLGWGLHCGGALGGAGQGGAGRGTNVTGPAGTTAGPLHGRSVLNTE